MPIPDEREKERISKLIPEPILRRMGQAAAMGKLGFMAVLTPEMIEELGQGKTTYLDLEDGGIVVLVPQVALQAVYEGDENERK